ncbi:OmpA family protein [Sulfitobacter sabulilitoris]|uniref:OmpA family protein n=1 Tax=Sulfitobacter sabulilitoris TaxID=2562655 RepID=A0A5S3PLF6_9RHOB|nr:OmpA family protein [Sulfitobacter sabulilitoris]TMM55229.1 OmpA family protein [Sulfitobacter sabulilitoris]
MQKRTPLGTLTLAGLVASLAACTTSNDPVLTQFHREAGALTDGGSFGAASMNNMVAMTNPQQFRLDLAKRFAAEVDSTVTFAFNSAQLEPAARAALTQQAQWIRQFPEIRFRVYGHTDAVGSAEYNKALGLRRAVAAVNFLKSQGINGARLEALASFGETRPVVPTPGRERLNRRTVTEVSGFVGSHPAVLDGKYAQIVYREYVASAIPKSQLTGTDASDLTTGQ